MNPPAAPNAAASEKILVRGVNWLGDAVMSVPALQRLREAKPGARISLLAPEKLAGLWERQPFLDELLLFSPGDSLWQTARRLRAEQFSAAAAFPNSLRAALELWLAGIPRRIGYARGGRTLFLTHPLPPRAGAAAMRKRSAGEIRQLIARAESPPPLPPSAHHIHDYLRLAAALGASAEPLPPRITICQEEVEKIAARLGLPAAREDRPVLGLSPGAEYRPGQALAGGILHCRRRRHPPGRALPLDHFWRAGRPRNRAAHFDRPRPAPRRAAGHQPGRPDHFARTGRRAPVLPPAPDQRQRPDAPGRRRGHAGRGSFRQHLAGNDRAGDVRRRANPARARHSLRPLFPARLSDRLPLHEGNHWRGRCRGGDARAALQTVNKEITHSSEGQEESVGTTRP